MDYRCLFSDVEKRPNAYAMSPTFAESVGFVQGCDAGNEWGLLIGFPEWLALRYGTESNIAWPALIKRAADAETTELSDAHRRTVLFRPLVEFLSERNGRHSARLIIGQYARRKTD